MTEPVLDSVIFNEMIELMGDALGEFIETFLDNSPKLLANIEKGLSEGDFDLVFHNAHQLKGGSGSIGAMQIFRLSKILEEKGREQSVDAQSVFAELQQAYAEVVTALSSHL